VRPFDVRVEILWNSDSMDLAIRLFKRALTEPYWFRAHFVLSTRHIVRWELLQARAGAVANAPEPEIGSGCEIVEVDRIYWMDEGSGELTGFCNRSPVVQMDDGEYIMI
jgi:hypothetical protein